MKKSNGQQINSWDGYFKAFLKLLPTVSQSIDQRTVFCDACRIFSLSIRGAVELDPAKKDEIEKQYQIFLEKYGKDGMGKIAVLLSYVVEALELRRSDFLGHVYEALSATNKHFGQFLTPDSVAKMMAQINLSGCKIERGKILRLNDCSCGAGALLIEAAEAFIANGGRQCDLVLYGEDLDPTASYITYVQFSLLGYAAVVTHQDSLSREIYEGPWYTPGYFAHGMPMRLRCEKMDEVLRGLAKGEEQPSAVQAEGPSETAESEERPSAQNQQPAINVRELVQGEFNLLF